MILSERLRKVPPYIFVELDRLKKEAIERGEDVISLSIGDPDLPTPPVIVEALAEAAAKPENHCYPLGTGKPAFREEIAHYYESRHGVKLDPATQIVALIGSKEGIGHLPLALINPGDVVLCPEPGYPVYQISTLFAGGQPYVLPLKADNGFLPDLDAVPQDVLQRTRLIWLNYPNNPTATFAPMDFFEKVVWLAKKHGFVVAHDAAYLDIAFPGEKPHSFLETPGAMDVGIELHSFSKTFNMTGWRLGLAAGNPEIVAALAAIKSNLDSGVFGAVQDAGIVAMRHFDALVPPILDVYRRRRDVLLGGLERIGWKNHTRPEGTFYVWLPTLGGRTAMEMTMELLRRCAVMVTPGTAFGASGEGFIRIALTAPEERICEALERIERTNLK
jgi:LL-diaminopimelate aminotransferase